MKYGVIFDLDGTLWDACQPMADAWNAYVNRVEPQLQLALTYDDLHRACGMTMDAFSAMLLKGMDPERRKVVSEACWDYEVEYMKEHGGDIFPGIREMLKRLHAMGYALYIVSNCQEGYIENFIAQSGAAEYIEDTENYGRTRMEKAQNIRLLMERNHLEQAVYVGDTQGDLLSARKAGILFLHAAYGFGEVSEADGRVETVEELPAAVEKVFAQARGDGAAL